jgi:micrococcal nuclease
VAGREVRLVLDDEERDRYGRMLAYVYSGDVFVNARLLREGYAEPIVVRPNDRYADRFATLARDARLQRRGLWASCSS